MPDFLHSRFIGRLPLLPGALMALLALVLTLAPLPAGADTTDNCDPDGNGAWTCFARNHPGMNNWEYDIASVGNDRTATITNLYENALDIWVTQFLRMENVGVLQPGETMQVRAFDHIAAMFDVSVSLHPDDRVPLIPEGARLVTFLIDPPSPAKAACEKTCLSRFSSCNKSCGMAGPGKPGCQLGCDISAKICLASC